MRILFLTQIVPYPPDAGPKVKTWHVLRYLVDRGHDVVLDTFVREEELEFVNTLRELCTEVNTIPIKRSRLLDVRYWLKSQLNDRPFLIERDDITAMRRLVREQLSTGSIDVFHADQLTMTQYALDNKVSSQPFTVFDAHNAVWSIVERMHDNAAIYLKPVLKLEAKRIKQYEGMIIEKFNHTLAVTDVDRNALIEASKTFINSSISNQDVHSVDLYPKVSIFPITVDTEKLLPINRLHGSKNILTLGSLHYPPNADGILWFVKEVFPLIREREHEATLTIIGKHPPQDLIQLTKNEPNICVTGYVHDLKPYMEAAAIIVVPVRAGSGMRVRILEAFAQAMPVVTTTIGIEGIQAIDGIDVLVQDTNTGFASAVIQLLTNGALQMQLATNGRRIARELYDWKTGLKGLDEIYKTKSH
jgi:glycosyltransferase involved in cell wall biosynthesis